MKIASLLAASLCAAAGVASAADPAPKFLSAKPVWLEGREKELNLSVGFRVTFDGGIPANAVLRMTGSTVYRVFVNDGFAGYGPARGPHGYDRVDEWPLRHPKIETVAIEVAGYNANSYYLLNQPSYFQAEIVAGDTVLASTGGAGKNFEALALDYRVQKAPRYSFQRPFSEVYRLTPGSQKWRTQSGALQPQKLAVQPQRPLLPRIAPYPQFSVRPPRQEVFSGMVKNNPDKKLWTDRAIKNTGPQLIGFPERELDSVPVYEVQRLETATKEASSRRLELNTPFRLADHAFSIVDFGMNDTGFIHATLKCDAPTRVYLVFDEILKGDDVDITRYSCSNVVTYDLTAPGAYQVESFEPYTLRYLKIITVGAPCEVSGIALREYVNPDADRAKFASSDKDLDRIFEAARETFKQNAVDTFTDCPGRERAGWLCDSFFSGRTARCLCGNTGMERLFFQNYLLPQKFEFLPDGMLPMCYPADHNDKNFIPNWAMWFVIELDEYLARSGDREMVDALRPRVLALLDYFKAFKNSDGLLEKLKGWVFVEWSRANALVQDVNYPSNMTYAEVLSCAARLYGMPGLEAEAAAIRDTVRKQSYNGTFFVDNALRQPDGTLKPSGECTETCQYYAFFFKTATPQTHPELWATLRDDFGPKRRAGNKHPSIHFANAFIGNYLRLELLSRQGLSAQILDETKGYLLKMADQTGTLWENDDTSASCCHGFAGHAAYMLFRDVLGVASIDPLKKAVTLSFADVPLDTCTGTIPTGAGNVTVSWRKSDGKLLYRADIPPGFTLTTDTTRLSIPAVRE